MQHIVKEGSGIYKEKGSKFIGIAVSVSSDTEVDEKLKQIAKEHSGSRHICYAYKFRGSGTVHIRQNDAGEPSGTAGLPVFRQIEKAGLINALVVVVRYFGGVKLGKGGLINAYRSAAEDAISSAHTAPFLPSVILTAEVSPENVPQLYQLIHKDDAVEIIEETYDSLCVLRLKIAESKVKAFRNKIKSIDTIRLHESS